MTLVLHKGVCGRKTRIWDLTPLIPPKTSPRAQNVKMGLDALGTAENESRSAKHENGIWRPRYRRNRVRERRTWKRDPTPSVPAKTSPGAQNVKMGPYALRTAENESRSTKPENGTRRTRHRQKRVGSTKHGNMTQRSRYRRKWVRERKRRTQDPDAPGIAENEFGSAKRENGT
jgi:hypothetical protein